eukprot:1706906-Pyramimonas_sp.AAC.1
MAADRVRAARGDCGEPARAAGGAGAGRETPSPVPSAPLLGRWERGAGPRMCGVRLLGDRALPGACAG